MSGSRWTQYQDELNSMNAGNRTARDIQLDLYKSGAAEILKHFNIYAYHPKQLDYVVKFLLSKVGDENLDWYFDILVSSWYDRQLSKTNNCPKISSVFDLMNKYDKVNHFASDKSLWV